jgi:hypothetical protein
MYVAFYSFDFERTWLSVFLKRVVRTKFDIYIFIIINTNILFLSSYITNELNMGFVTFRTLIKSKGWKPTYICNLKVLGARKRKGRPHQDCKNRLRSPMPEGREPYISFNNNYITNELNMGFVTFRTLIVSPVIGPFILMFYSTSMTDIFVRAGFRLNNPPL